MRRTLLQMGPLFEHTQKSYEENYDIHKLWEAADQDALIESIADRCTGVVTDGGKGVSNAVLEKLPNVKVITVFGVGVDAIDLDYCKNNQITVGNTPDVLSDDVADLAVSLALATCRQVAFGDRYARDGKWPKQGPMPLTTRMSGKTAGIFGMGSIGDSLAKRLSGFDMPIKYCNRSAKSGCAYEYVDTAVKLAKDVDFLFITASANENTVGAINNKVLDALGTNGYLINVARGTLVDETTMVDYLVNRKIAGAGLDVFENEPGIPKALLSLDNVVLQPHNASGTWETRKAMGELSLSNIAAFFDNKPLPAKVI